MARRLAKFSWLNLGNVPQPENIWRSVYNIHQIKPSGELKSSFFKGDGISCDIALLTTRERARLGFKPKKRPITAGLVELGVKDVLEVSGSGVSHVPLITIEREKHYSHCEFAKKLTDGQARGLVKRSNLVIKPTFDFTDSDQNS